VHALGCDLRRLRQGGARSSARRELTRRLRLRLVRLDPRDYPRSVAYLYLVSGWDLRGRVSFINRRSRRRAIARAVRRRPLVSSPRWTDRGAKPASSTTKGSGGPGLRHRPHRRDRRMDGDRSRPRALRRQRVRADHRRNPGCRRMDRRGHEVLRDRGAPLRRIALDRQTAKKTTTMSRMQSRLRPL
jgi:hypothetical protein